MQLQSPGDMPRRRLEDARSYYEAVERSTSYQKQMYAECLILLGLCSEAVAVLEEIPDTERNPFVLHRYAKALLGAQRCSDAVIAIERALAALRDEKYRSAFLDVKADALRTIGREDALEVLRAAIAACESGKYRDALLGKAERWGVEDRSK